MKLTPELWEEVRGHLAHCLDLSTGERGVYLYELGRRSDTGRAVKHEVESLLADCPTANFLAEPPGQADDGADAVASSTLGRIGHYAIQRELGRGGMGTVYHAVRDDNEYQAEVAIKVLRGGLASGFFARRFRLERQLLAYLNHGSIVRLVDGGTTEDGRPFLVTEYVSGEPLLAWTQEHRLNLAARLRLFLPVCDAVHHAHQNLIIHCDIKPGNVMVNRQGVPKLLDFGIARLLMPTTAPGDITEAGMRLMTLAYASPEQIRGERVTTATDVYSLGCTLFELLTGAPPFGKARPLESLDADPPAASARIRPGSSALAAGELKGDLDNVLRKAMDPVPSRRYESAEQFAADVRRVLDHEPVLARPLTRRYRLQKFLRRNRPLVLGLGSGVAALALSAVISLHQWRVAAGERDQARRLYENAHRLAHSFVFDVDDALLKSGPTGARRLIVEQGLASLDRLAAESSAAGVVRRELPAAYLKMGDVLGRQGAANVGRTADAQRSYERALAIARELLQSEPDNDELQRVAASANTRLAGVLKIQGRYREALVRGLEAGAILKARCRRASATLSDRRALAAAWQDVGSSYAHLGQMEQAGAIRREALAQLEAVASIPGAGPDDRAAMILGRIRLAAILIHEKRFADAGAEAGRATAEARSLERTDLIASALHMEGLNFREQKRWADALVRHRESLRLREERAAADPSDWRMSSLAASSLLRVAEAEVALGMWNAGVGDLERVLAIRARLSAADPANSGAQAELGEVHDFLGNAWLLRDRTRARDHWGTARRVFEPLAGRGLLGQAQLDQLAAIRQKLEPSR